MSRYDDFDAKVGETEDNFCGCCDETRPHIWVKRKRDPYLVDPAFYEFHLKCKYCGNEGMIYTTE